MVPAVKVIEFEPATAVTVPPQVLAKPFGVATTNPDERVSVTAISVMVKALMLFVSVMVREVVPPRGSVEAPNAWVTCGPSDPIAGIAARIANTARKQSGRR
jgi:hypothetical protein